ncbi:putative glutamate carboxypeptidase [Hyphodiscus hymeniophilus]|uniref:Glutamate carboxypeptidase n=1 Tax=Hyphodiscus hymeniophilus TaxID=353542 RepID=A0A9P7AUV2_9HELO|nr:putative glutamate carboxypeptidase [Hyphodiscus hymeniophilus]
MAKTRSIDVPSPASVSNTGGPRIASLHICRVQTRIRPLVVLAVLSFCLMILQPGQGMLCLLRLQSQKSCLFVPHTIEKGFDFARLENLLQVVPSAVELEEWSLYYTSQAHFAGQGKDQGIWTKHKWEEFGIPETEMVSYKVFVGNPVRQRLALLKLLDDVELAPELLYDAVLIEDMPEDDTSRVRTPAYHSGSFTGNVTGQFIYANFGLSQDYDDLEKAKVDLKGKIAVVKYGEVFRGDKMHTAAARGIIGIVLYTDPQQDGELTEAHGYKPYPDGPARPSTYIERGAVEHFGGNSSGSNPSVDGESIPSIPVSYNDIIPILTALNGNGPRAEDMGERWCGGGLSHKGVEYHIGPSPPRIVLNLENQMEYVSKEIYDVFGKIRGSTSEEEVVILGNHRDAWTAGAGDPNSGSAALMEVVRSFAVAYKAGWRPRRTIMFVSWEGEELGQAGSEPWVVENQSWLSKVAVGYLNVVVAGAGQKFHAKATPLLRQIIHEAARAVQSPVLNSKGVTILDQWGGEIGTPGGGDAIQFLQKACISTVDIGFSPGPVDPTFPYHSNFDTFSWINSTGDPGWNYHLATTKVWSIMAAHLVEDPVLKFNATDYATGLTSYVEFAKKKLADPSDFDLSPLECAIAEFRSTAILFDSYASSLSALVLKENSSWGHKDIARKIRALNKTYMSIESRFCYQEGEHESEHVLFRESPWYQSPPALPRLLESFESKNWSQAIFSSFPSVAWNYELVDETAGG